MSVAKAFAFVLLILSSFNCRSVETESVRETIRENPEPGFLTPDLFVAPCELILERQQTFTEASVREKLMNVCEARMRFYLVRYVREYRNDLQGRRKVPRPLITEKPQEPSLDDLLPPRLVYEKHEFRKENGRIIKRIQAVFAVSKKGLAEALQKRAVLH